MAKKTKKPPTVKKKDDSTGVRISEIPGEVRLERSPFKLKGKIQYLSTDIDSLKNYVIEHKKVTLRDAAAKFKVPAKTVEDWGKILEDHRMIDLHYPIAGEPILKVHEPKKSWKQKKAEREKLKELEKQKKAELKAKGQAPAEEAPREKKSGPRRFTKKRLLIMAEVIILAEILIYIFVVNPHLRNNFLPTLNYQITNLPANLANAPAGLSQALSTLFGRQMVINPLYFVIGILIVVFWLVFAFMRKRKKSSFAREWRKRHSQESK